MRISDWSSDVCSSDLLPRSRLRPARDAALWRPWPQRARAHRARSLQRRTPARLCRKRLESHLWRAALLDRKSVVSGKSVSVRVDVGGGGIVKKKKKKQIERSHKAT